MSVNAIAQVMEWDIPDGLAKLVAMVLADYADGKTGRCWPKIATLAQQCSQSERTVQRKIKVLATMRRLHIEPNLTGDRKGNVYVLHLRGVPVPPMAGDAPPTGDTGAPGVDGAAPTGDCASPVAASQGPFELAAERHPSGDRADTRRVTLESPPKESTRESTRESVTDPDGSAPRGGAAGQDFQKMDFRKELNVRGVRTMRELTGRPELKCRVLIGSWLRFVDDDAVTVMRAIDEAVEAEAIDPVSWIEARLTRRSNGGPPTAGPAGTPMAPGRAAQIQADAAAAAARGEWPIGGTVFVREDSPDGRAWTEHFRRFGTKPKWRQCREGWGGYMPSRMPPAAAA